jgi:hypothetical protein
MQVILEIPEELGGGLRPTQANCHAPPWRHSLSREFLPGS